MTLINDAASRTGTLHTLIVSAQGLTCGKQSPQGLRGGIVAYGNPGRSRVWAFPPTQPCTLITAT